MAHAMMKLKAAATMTRPQIQDRISEIQDELDALGRTFGKNRERTALEEEKDALLDVLCDELAAVPTH